MTTDKNRINAYIDDSAFEAFKAFCSQWECSQSKGIELLIKHSLLGTVPSKAPGSVSRNDNISEIVEKAIEDKILKEYQALSNRIDDLEKEIRHSQKENHLTSFLLFLRHLRPSIR